MNDATVVNVLQCKNSFREVHASHVERETTDVLKKSGYIATFNVLHYHVEMVLGYV